jgi:RNA polymerase sigma factor (sigma-70 family)
MDRDRVAELYAVHVPSMRRLAFLMLGGDAARSEDLVHEAFIQAAARLPTLRDQDRFGAYFRRAVVNGVTSHGRRRAVESRWLSTQSSVAAAAVEADAFAELASAAAVAELLSSLPERQRLAVTARFCLDLSEAQTATLLGCSVGTVKSLTSRGLASLRDVVGASGRPASSPPVEGPRSVGS